MAIPFLVFWIILIISRQELGCRNVMLCIVLWILLFAGFMFLEISVYFVVAQVICDAILILILFGGDIRIR